MVANSVPDVKGFAFDELDRNANEIALLNDSIFYFGELGMQEFESCSLLCSLLEDGGFHLQRNLSGFPTGFCATWGSGEPVIAVHAEYDANPDNSQRPGVNEASAIVEGAPGHCEGHNSNAAVMIAAVLATKSAMQKYGISGCLKVFGAPAEEQLVSRPYFVRDGHFDDVDIAMTAHIGSQFSVGYGLIQSALISAYFTFHGESAHAGSAPWKGRDALDAVILMDVGMAEYREHMKPQSMCQRVITQGGDQPNVIPKRAQVWWYFRGPTAEAAWSVFERAKKVAEGAALMTDTTVAIEVQSAVWPVRSNRTLAELVQKQYEQVGPPDWSSEEDCLARALQLRAGVNIEGLFRDVYRMRGPAIQKGSSNDAGDISWKVPMVKFYFPGNIPNISYHHWAAGVALATSIAHKGAVAGAKVLAASLIEIFCKPEIVSEAKRLFNEEKGGVTWFSMLPADQKPPVDLNRATMERYRSRMREHYQLRRPRWSTLV